jgi:ubiquitin carboxyl-terminal hydrolase 10
VHVSQSSSGETSQQVLLEVLPAVLILHIERFLYDAATGGINKIATPVQFAPELGIPRGTTSHSSVQAKANNSSCSMSTEIMAPVDGESAEPAHYKLYGVLYHHGESAGGGHYTVDVLHPNGDSEVGKLGCTLMMKL